MKRFILSALLFVSLPIFADRLIKENFYSGKDNDISVSRQYYYGKNGNLESIRQVNDESGIRINYIYKKKQLIEAEEYNDDILVSHSVFLYRDNEETPYRREVYDSLNNLKSYSLFTFEANGKNPLIIKTYNDKNELLEQMVFVYSNGNLSEIQILDDTEKLILCHRQIIDENKNALTEEVIFQGKIIRTIKREFVSSRKKSSKIFSLPNNFFDFK